jgi:hypothetical protein
MVKYKRKKKNGNGNGKAIGLMNINQIAKLASLSGTAHILGIAIDKQQEISRGNIEGWIGKDGLTGDGKESLSSDDMAIEIFKSGIILKYGKRFFNATLWQGKHPVRIFA